MEEETTTIHMINLSYLDEYLDDFNAPFYVIEKSKEIVNDFCYWYQDQEYEEYHHRTKNVYSSSALFTYLGSIFDSKNSIHIAILRQAIKDTQFRMII